MVEKPFVVRPFGSNGHLVANVATGEIWHRVFHRVAYADTDRANVVYHANYLRFFEIGRTEMMRAGGYAYSQVEADGYLFPVVGAELRYVRFLRYDDPAWIYTRPSAESDGV